MDVDPDTYLTPPKMIRKHGYPAESHIIKSEDGYLLEYYRIPYGKGRDPSMNKPYPILLHHGLLSSSVDWIIKGPEKSLGYLLADRGYDVWLANARGSTYSRTHVSLGHNHREFWDYTFHEMAIYDLPAAIDHILSTSKAEKLVYIGHSMGTTTFFVFAATRPEYSSKILFQISLAPVGGISHLASPIRLLVPHAKTVATMYDWFYKGAFLQQDFLTSMFSKKFICAKEVIDCDICEQLVLSNLFGKNPEQFDESLLPKILSNFPAGSSIKNLLHMAQLVSSGSLSYFDYGFAENMLKYHSAIPPAYNLSSITIPIRFYYGKNDLLAHPIDVELLYQKIPKPLGLVLIDHEKWNHADFLWAIDNNKYLNDEMLNFIEQSTSQPESLTAVVENSLNKRSGLKAPVDEPFDEVNFLNKFDLSELDAFPKSLSDEQNKTEGLLKTGVNTIKTGVNDVQNKISGSVKKTTKTIHDGIDKTATSVKTAIQGGLDTAKIPWIHHEKLLKEK